MQPGSKTAAVVLTLGLGLVGCEGDDGMNGRDGIDGADGLNTLVAVRDIRPGDAQCPGGGVALDSGLDANGNGTLENDEITETSLLECATAPMLRAFHASPDAPDVNVIVDGATALADVPFKTGSGFLEVDESTRVQIEAIIPGGNAVVIDEMLELDFATEYTVAAIDTVDSIMPFVIANPNDEPIPLDSFRAQVLHAAPSAPPVDVYVTAPGADLTASSPINSGPIAFPAVTDRVTAPAGTYQVRITAGGDPSTVVFDSGEIELSDSADLLIAAVDNTGPGSAPVQLVVLDASGSSILLDANTPASVVAVHASPDAPNVDILADDNATAGDDGIALATDVPYAAFCEIAAVPAPGDYTINVTAAGDPSTVALTFPLVVAPADEFTAIVTGYLMSTPAIQPLALGADSRSVATEAKVRVIHGAPGTGDVDVYVVADGTDLAAEETMPTFGAVPFTGDSGIVSLAPATYDVYVTPAGDKATVAIEVQDVTLEGGEVLDVIARDPLTDGSEGPLPQLIVIDYTALPAC